MIISLNIVTRLAFIEESVFSVRYELNFRFEVVNPLKAELNPICHLLALLAHHILHVSRIRVNQEYGFGRVNVGGVSFVGEKLPKITPFSVTSL
jgi:hypothetical protein